MTGTNSRNVSKQKAKHFANLNDLPFNQYNYNPDIKLEWSTERNSKMYIHHNGDVGVFGKHDTKKVQLENANLIKWQLKVVDVIKHEWSKRGINRKVNQARYANFNIIPKNQQKGIIERKLAVILDCDFGDFLYVIYLDENGKLKTDIKLDQTRVISKDSQSGF